MYRVVIVDDEIHIADGLAKLITHTDDRFSVDSRFYDSHEALEYLRNRPEEAELLVTDISMPGLSGLDLAKEVRKLNPRLQIIIISGYSEFEYAKEAIACGVTAYLLKPVDSEELKEVLQKVSEQLEDDHSLLRIVRETESGLIRSIRSYIGKNYREFSLTAMAEEMQMNAEYLSRVYKKETGTTINAYLVSVRMEQAALLLEGDASIKVYEVSDLVGYQDRIYFARQFQKAYGMLPKEYQQYGSKKKSTE